MVKLILTLITGLIVTLTLFTVFALALAFDAEGGSYNTDEGLKRFFSSLTISPDTEVLVISESCAPCVKAVEIITKLQDEGYDVVIVDRKSTLAKKYRVKATPTLVVREHNKRSKKVVGLKTEEKYRELISQ